MVFPFLTRSFASLRSSRTVPYITKGQWKLPLPDGVAPVGVEVNTPKNWRKTRSLPNWKRQMFALKEKFPEGWNPKRRLSPSDMEALRATRRLHPLVTVDELSERFRIGPEAVRRILKSKWRPSTSQETAKREKRWERRGERLGAMPDTARGRLAETKRRKNRPLVPPDHSNTIL